MAPAASAAGSSGTHERVCSMPVASDSQLDPFRSWIRLPHYDTGLRYENEPSAARFRMRVMHQRKNRLLTRAAQQASSEPRPSGSRLSISSPPL